MNFTRPRFAVSLVLAFWISAPATASPSRTRARTNLAPVGPPPPIGCVTTAPTTYITYPFTLTMRVNNSSWVDHVNINNVDIVPPQAPGQAVYYGQGTAPPNPGTYTFPAYITGPSGRIDCNASVTVILPPPPTCALAASPANITYDCGRFAGGVTLTEYVNGILLTRILLDGVPQSLSSLTHSKPVNSPGGHNGSASNRGGTGSCSLYVGQRCSCNGQLDNQPGWGYHWCPGNDPPACIHRFHCYSGDCLNALGGQDVERGCVRGGCFDPESRLLMGDGTTRRAADVHKGDLLWNPVRGKAFPVALRIVGPEKLPLLSIGYGEFRVKVTTTHPMLTRAGLKKAEDVSLQDFVFGADLKYHRVTEKRALAVRKDQIVYNFRMGEPSDVTDDHLIVSDGIVTGDHYLQENLGVGIAP